MIKYMYKHRFIILNLRKKLINILFLTFIICLIIFSDSNIVAVKDGLSLWINSIVPSLFPFFIAVELLSYTNIINKLEKIFSPIMIYLFNVPGAGAFALVMGIISGYPTGAKIVKNIRQKNICTKEEAERLLAFTNNSGPLFIIGTIGVSFFYNSTIGFLLLITHILASLSVGIIFRFWKSKKTFINDNYYNSLNKKENEISLSDLGEILGKSISNAISTIVMIGGFVVLFSVVISILNNSYILTILSILLNKFLTIFGITLPQFTTPFLSGIIEITNGIKMLSTIPYKQISVNIIISSFLLGFGGVSIMLQVWSIISDTDISIKPYIIGKLLQGFFSSIYTYLFINLFSIFNLNL